MSTLYVLVLVFTMNGQTSIKTVKDDFPDLDSCDKARADVSVMIPVDKFFGGGKAYYDCRLKEAP